MTAQNPIGKSIFVWNIEQIHKGDVQRIAETLRMAGFESALIHHTNVINWDSSPRRALARALQEAGLQAWGSAAVYGAKPANEGSLAARMTQDYGLTGFLFDAEGIFDLQPKADSNAVHLLQAYRAGTQQPSIWCWWAFHRGKLLKAPMHPKSVLWAALDPTYGDATYGAPMAYWGWGDTPGKAVEYLGECWTQWREINQTKPIIPIGRAYIGNGGTPRPDAIIAFEARARQLGAPACSWWSMEHALDAVHLPGVWQALAGLPRFGPAPEPPGRPEPPPSLEQRVTEVEQRVTALERSRV